MKKEELLLKVINQAEKFLEDPDLENVNYYLFTQQVSEAKDLSDLEKISTEFIEFFHREVQESKLLTPEKKTELTGKNTIAEIAQALGVEKSTPETGGTSTSGSSQTGKDREINEFEKQKIITYLDSLLIKSYDKNGVVMAVVDLNKLLLIKDWLKVWGLTEEDNINYEITFLGEKDYTGKIVVESKVKTVTQAETIRASVLKNLYGWCYHKLGGSGDPEFAQQILKDFVNQVILPEISIETGGYSLSTNPLTAEDRATYFAKDRRESLGADFPHQITQDKWTVIENYLRRKAEITSPPKTESPQPTQETPAESSSTPPPP